MNTIRTAFTILFASVCLIQSCKETDEYYQILKDQPEMLIDYADVYAINDTLQITGRFKQEDLIVKVGDANAEIVGFQSRLNRAQNAQGYNDSIQEVRVLIDETMGIGMNRPVQITSAGSTLQGKNIEIIEDAGSGILPGELTVEKIADYPAGYLPVYCRSGNGNMYFRSSSTHQVIRMLPDGSTETVFQTADLKMSDGSAIRFTRIDGMGIDPSEHYLYLSVFTAYTGSEPESFYRLFRWDMSNQTLKMLNETPYHRLLSRRTLSSIQPFEGPINEVKMFVATNIFPDSKGNVYFDMDSRFVTRLDGNGNYSYIFKNPNSNWSSSVSDVAPELYNAQAGAAYRESFVRQALPGIFTSSEYMSLLTIAPESDQLFTVHYNFSQETGGYRYSFGHYNLRNRTFVNGFANQSSSENRIISGSFPVLTGWVNSNVRENLWGALPLEEEGLLILYNSNNARYPNQWGILDFTKERGKRYTPGIFDKKDYQLSATDALLNHDGQGMLYMTANNRSVILKTVYK